MTEIAKNFEEAHPGHRVDVSYGGSQLLAHQLSLGAPADLFLSADRAQMGVVVASKRIDRRDIKPLASTRLCLLVSAKAKNRIRGLADLTEPGVRLCLADSRVPVGGYTAEALTKAAKSFGPLWLSKVRSKVVSFESNASAVALRVELGEADAGIVYETDARLAKSAVGYEIPTNFNVRTLSYFAILRDSPNPMIASKFAELLSSKRGQAVFIKFGFAPPR